MRSSTLYMFLWGRGGSLITFGKKLIKVAMYKFLKLYKD
jgi:hypothetical protein